MKPGRTMILALVVLLLPAPRPFGHADALSVEPGATPDPIEGVAGFRTPVPTTTLSGPSAGASSVPRGSGEPFPDRPGIPERTWKAARSLSRHEWTSLHPDIREELRDAEENEPEELRPDELNAGRNFGHAALRSTRPRPTGCSPASLGLPRLHVLYTVYLC